MVRWAVQYNLAKQNADDIEAACKKLNYKFVGIKVIPFSKEIPDIPNDDITIFYGATKWIDNIYQNNRWGPGVYFNPDAHFETWVEKYGEAALNYGAEITTLNELSYQPYPDDRLLFIRPTRDMKEFNGDVWEFGKIKRWSHGIITDVDTEELARIPIVVSEPYGIAHEWRLFMVGGKVSSGSHYRSYHKLNVSKDVPKKVVEFAEQQAKVYSPCSVFVMDVCESAGNLYVVEVGCFHSAGFYAADIEKVVRDVSEFAIGAREAS